MVLIAIAMIANDNSSIFLVFKKKWTYVDWKVVSLRYFNEPSQLKSGWGLATTVIEKEQEVVGSTISSFNGFMLLVQVPHFPLHFKYWKWDNVTHGEFCTAALLIGTSASSYCRGVI